jgi:predicted nucleic acid-binding protein
MICPIRSWCFGRTADDETAYDACYVALAQRNGIPLVTADEKLVRLLAGTPYSVEALRTFPIPRPD